MFPSQIPAEIVPRPVLVVRITFTPKRERHTAMRASVSQFRRKNPFGRGASVSWVGSICARSNCIPWRLSLPKTKADGGLGEGVKVAGVAEQGIAVETLERVKGHAQAKPERVECGGVGCIRMQTGCSIHPH
jgi:hypothetical protein